MKPVHTTRSSVPPAIPGLSTHFLYSLTPQLLTRIDAPQGQGIVPCCRVCAVGPLACLDRE
jgi:hypothetical protein